MCTCKNCKSIPIPFFKRHQTRQDDDSDTHPECTPFLSDNAINQSPNYRKQADFKGIWLKPNDFGNGASANSDCPSSTEDGPGQTAQEQTTFELFDRKPAEDPPKDNQDVQQVSQVVCRRELSVRWFVTRMERETPKVFLTCRP